MFDLLHKIIQIDPPFNMVILIMLIIFSSVTITSVASQVRKYYCMREELEFKREMLARGMTPEEADQWLRTKTPRSFG